MRTVVLASLLCLSLSCCRDTKSPSNVPLPANSSFELAVVVNPRDLTDAELARSRMELKEGKLVSDNLHAKWVKIHDLKLWTELPKDRAAVEADPYGRYITDGRIVDASAGSAYILIRSGDTSVLDQLTIHRVQQTENALGYPSIDLEFSKESQQQLDALIAANKDPWIAAVLDGEVISTVRQPPWIQIWNFKNGRKEIVRLVTTLKAQAR